MTREESEPVLVGDAVASAVPWRDRSWALQTINAMVHDRGAWRPLPLADKPWAVDKSPGDLRELWMAMRAGHHVHDDDKHQLEIFNSWCLELGRSKGLNWGRLAGMTWAVRALNQFAAEDSAMADLALAMRLRLHADWGVEDVPEGFVDCRAFIDGQARAMYRPVNVWMEACQ